MSDAGASTDWVDPLIHSPARFAIVTELFVLEAADATFLRHRTGLTWGNLSSHLGKLEQAGYVDVQKRFRGRKPCTMISLTEKGRAAFQAYRRGMQEALADIPDA